MSLWSDLRCCDVDSEEYQLLKSAEKYEYEEDEDDELGPDV